MGLSGDKAFLCKDLDTQEEFWIKDGHLKPREVIGIYSISNLGKLPEDHGPYSSLEELMETEFMRFL